MRAISIAKFEKDIVNEDAVIARKNVIAVSDGAGGGGVFAERWSQYLVSNLPDKPITDYINKLKADTTITLTAIDHQAHPSLTLYQVCKKHE